MEGKNYCYSILLFTSTVSIILLGLAVIIVGMNPATGYEESIYLSTPLFFWISIIINLTNGFIIVVLNIYAKTKINWLLGLSQIVFSYSMCILLFALRGYVIYHGRGDVSSYVGYVIDIVNYGETLDYNFYPGVSLLISNIVLVCNLPVVDLFKYMPSLFYAFYVLYIYCWSKAILNKKVFILSSTLAATPVFFAWFSVAIYHQLISVLMLPLLFYCIEKSSKKLEFRLLCILLLLSAPIFHPLNAIVIILYLATWFLVEHYFLNNIGRKNKISLNLILISLVAILFWFINQFVILRSIKSVVSRLLGFIDLATSSEIALGYMSRLGFKDYSRSLLMVIDEMIYYILIAVIIVILLKSKDSNHKKIIIPIVCFLVGTFYLVISYISTNVHVPERLINLNFNMMLVGPIIGYFIYFLYHKLSMLKIACVFFLIFISSIGTVFSIYPSPMVLRANEQITSKDINGADWLITNKEQSIRIADVATPINKFVDFKYGCYFRVQRGDLYRDYNIPSHFNMSGNSYFPTDRDRYLVISEYDIVLYTRTWRKINRINEQDFNAINYCSNVNKLYENGEMKTYIAKKYSL